MIKKYLISSLIGLVIILASVAVLFRTSMVKQRDKANRWEANFTQLSLANSSLSVTLEELKDSNDSTITMLRDSLGLKSKQILRYRSTKVDYKDTTPVEILLPLCTGNIDDVLNPDSVNTIPYIESGNYVFVNLKECYTISGFVKLNNENKELSVKFTSVEFHMDSKEVIYKERKRKFLFVKFGKWQYIKAAIGNCGEYQTKEVEIIRK